MPCVTPVVSSSNFANCNSNGNANNNSASNTWNGVRPIPEAETMRDKPAMLEGRKACPCHRLKGSSDECG